MATTHRFEARLVWRKGGEGVAASNHSVTFADRPALALSSAPAYRGDPTRLNPEELFVASLASCQALSYLALAGRAGLDVLTYEDRPEGTLAMADKRMRMTEVVLHPRIVLAAGSDQVKAHSLVEAAHEICFIANSVACTVRAEAEIVVGG